MSTDANCADTRRTPPIPPQPPHRPAAPAMPPVPDEDPQTTVLRPVPADPTVPPPAAPPRPPAQPPAGPMPPRAAPPTAPPRPADRPQAPPRPRTPPPAGGPQVPPGPVRGPVAPPPPVPPAAPPQPRRPVSFRDTAAFHLANSQELWNAARSRTHDTPPPAPDRASATPLPPQGVGAYGAAPAAPPVRPRRSRRRRLAIAASLVLGIGLIGGAAAGSWLTEGTDAPPTPEASFSKGRNAWRNTPVDTLFPRTVNGLGVGPGGSDRRWTRIAVAPDSTCAKGLDPALAKALAPVGCTRLLRATYVDATRSRVITVGALTSKADAKGMLALNSRFSTRNLATRTTMMPLPYAAKGTPAADFGPAQRASWTVRILTDIPVVVYAVSGFADGRAVTDPQPAEAAVRPGTTTAPAESGLGHDAKDLADRIEAIYRKAAGISTQHPEDP
ncbi:hypothetical protein AB0D04_35355 [Streptomyces sp. NPDC048483]|uniref:hypothetical protein n=1 Tax=Streptomyces sp. NPDC048483 TaxID=3154927 RepID=UPI00344728A6